MEYTKLVYELPSEGHVTLEIADMMGKRVALLTDERRQAGEHTVRLDASLVEPGVYLVKLRLKTAGSDLLRTIKLVRAQ